MAKYKTVKGTVSPANLWLYKFTNDLVACVSFACKQAARDISAQPDSAYGTEQRIQRVSVTPGGTAATNFSHSVNAPHANAYARHFLSELGRTARMDLGNLIEQLAYKRLRSSYSGWIEGHHYVYQSSTAKPPRFPISYMGAAKSARPDFRYEFYSGQPNGDEVVFDITTPSEAGHLLTKRIGATTIQAHPKIPIAVEIIWEDSDLYSA